MYCLIYKKKNGEALKCSSSHTARKCRCSECVLWNKEYWKKNRENNREKWRRYASEYDSRNREKRRLAKRAYAKKNLDKIRERSKKHYERNKKKLLEHTKEWRKQNPEKIREYSCNWKKSNPEKVNANNAKRRAKKRQATVVDRNEEVKEYVTKLYATQQYYKECHNIELHVDHIIPLSRGGTHVPENLRLISSEDNLRKRDKLDSELDFVPKEYPLL